ncbi:MAG: glycosyltransferase family 4 protein [Pseudomonadota bacterium]
MHVLQVTPFFPPTWAYGGIPRIVYGLGRGLTELGVRVTVLTTDAMDARSRAAVKPDRVLDGMHVLTCSNFSNRLAYDHQLFLPRGVAEALERVGQPDVVHLHGHRHLLNNFADRFARQHFAPTVLTANGTLLRHERKQAAKVLWDLAIAGRIPQRAARCVVVSQAERRQHVQAGLRPERLVEIPNGLDLGEFDPLPPRGLFRRRLGVDPEVPMVVYLGQLSPRKGVEHLVEAFNHHPPAGAVLVVGGNDMGGGHLARAAADPRARVHFVGLLEGAERIQLLVDADVLVYPSTAEVFGLVPFEGLLSGTPAVVGDDCGCGELIGGAGAGLLVRHGDVTALRETIQRLLDHRGEARAMVDRGRLYIHEHFSWPRVASMHLRMYEEILAEGGRRP